MRLPSNYSAILQNESLMDEWEVKVHNERMSEYTLKTLVPEGKMKPSTRIMIRLTVFNECQTMSLQTIINGKTIVIEDCQRQECEIWSRCRL
jgi:hypothetical protein